MQQKVAELPAASAAGGPFATLNKAIVGKFGGRPVSLEFEMPDSVLLQVF